MFKPHEKSTPKPLFRTKENDDSIEFFSDNYFMELQYKMEYGEENENYRSLDRLAKFMNGTIGGHDPVMARSYKNESEKNNFSLCVFGYRLNSVKDRHPVMQYLSAYEGLEITQEYQRYGASNVWIFTFPKTECENILTGMKALDLDGDLLESLAEESVSQAVFC